MYYAKIVKSDKNIDMWDAFKRVLNKYFYLENVEFEAYQKFRKLKHDGLVQGERDHREKKNSDASLKPSKTKISKAKSPKK